MSPERHARMLKNLQKMLADQSVESAIKEDIKFPPIEDESVPGATAKDETLGTNLDAAKEPAATDVVKPDPVAEASKANVTNTGTVDYDAMDEAALAKMADDSFDRLFKEEPIKINRDAVLSPYVPSSLNNEEKKTEEINAYGKKLRDAQMEQGLKEHTEEGPGQGNGEILSGVAGGMAQTLGFANGVAGTMLAENKNFNKGNTQYVGQQAVGNALMSTGNPYAMLAGAAWNGISTASEALGMNVNTISKHANKDIGLTAGQRIGNNIMGFIPGLGFATGAVSSALSSPEVDKARGAYAGTASDIDDANEMGGNRYFFGKKKIDDFIKEQNSRVNTITALSKYNTLRRSSDYGEALAQQNQNKYAGNTYNTVIGRNGMRLPSKDELSVILAKKGTKISKKRLAESDLYNIYLQCQYIATGDISAQIAKDAASLRNNAIRGGFTETDLEKLVLDLAYNKDYVGAVYELQQDIVEFLDDLPKKFNDDINLINILDYILDFEPQDLSQQEAAKAVTPLRDYIADYFGLEPTIEAFQNGGSIMNPAGALHAHLNHMEEENKEIGSQVTQKGIPVVTTDEEGNVEQVAEIERDEIIFSKELTTKIEELWHKGTDEAMIEAGKLIAEALIEDSTDNTGLFDKTE